MSGIVWITESSGVPMRQESEPALISAFFSTQKPWDKISESVIIGRMKFGSSGFSGKFSIFFITT